MGHPAIATHTYGGRGLGWSGGVCGGGGGVGVIDCRGRYEVPHSHFVMNRLSATQ